MNDVNPFDAPSTAPSRTENKSRLVSVAITTVVGGLVGVVIGVIGIGALFFIAPGMPGVAEILFLIILTSVILVLPCAAFLAIGVFLRSRSGDEQLMGKSDQNPIPAQAGNEMADPVGESTEKLLSVSKARRWVIVAALLYTLFILFHVVTKIGTGGHTQLPFAILIFSMFAVGRLAYALYGTWNALLYCLAQLIPGVGYISLLVLDWRATAFLKTNNARVGLWGDDPRPSPR